MGTYILQTCISQLSSKEGEGGRYGANIRISFSAWELTGHEQGWVCYSRLHHIPAFHYMCIYFLYENHDFFHSKLPMFSSPSGLFILFYKYWKISLSEKLIRFVYWRKQICFPSVKWSILWNELFGKNRIIKSRSEWHIFSCSLLPRKMWNMQWHHASWTFLWKIFSCSERILTNSLSKVNLNHIIYMSETIKHPQFHD